MENLKDKCLFCHIIQHPKSADILEETQDVLAFKDIQPQAPLHALIIPKQHIETVYDVNLFSTAYLSKMTELANTIAQKKGYQSKGYRLVINCGSDAGQSVWHLHMHLLAGRSMQWPPG